VSLAALLLAAAGDSGSQPFIDLSWPNINSTSFVAVTDVGASVLSTSGGQLQFSFSAQYDGGVAVCKAQYSLDNSTWTDVPSTETTGTLPTTTPGEEPARRHIPRRYAADRPDRQHPLLRPACRSQNFGQHNPELDFACVYCPPTLMKGTDMRILILTLTAALLAACSPTRLP